MLLCGCEARPCPRNRAVLLVLFISSLERYSNAIAVSGNIPPFLKYLGINKKTEQTKIASIIWLVYLNVFSACLCPVFGYLADVRLGRYRMIIFGLLLYVISHITGAMSFLIAESDHNHDESEAVTRAVEVALFFSYITLCFGSSAIQANILPFACDQLFGAYSEELSSLFHWYFWTRNIGNALFVLTEFAFGVFFVENDYHRASIMLTVATANISLALVILFGCKVSFTIKNEIRSPLKSVIDVTRFARKAKFDPFESAFTINTDHPPRLDLAKTRYGGPFTTEEVENVKTFYRVLLVLAIMMTSMMILGAMESVFPFLSLPNHQISIGKGKYGMTILWDSAVIFFLIPIIDRCVYPLLGAYIPTMLQRIGIGALLYMSAPAILIAAVVIYDSNTHSDSIDTCYFVLFGATVFALSIGEVFFEVAGLEFSYAQSPRDMNGFMIGMYYFFASLSSIPPAIILSVFIEHDFDVGVIHNGTWYNIILLLIAVPGYLFFLWVAVRYKRRRRDDEEADEENIIYENALEVLQSQMTSTTMS